MTEAHQLLPGIGIEGQWINSKWTHRNCLDYEIVIYYERGGDFLNEPDEKEKKREKAFVTMLTSNKIDFKAGNTLWDKKGHFIMMKGSVCQGNGRILKLYASNNIVSLHV